MNINAILTGTFGVGKSSIFRRFIYNDFNDKYSGTIGVRVNSKSIEISDARSVNFSLWDVAGEVHQNKVPIAYFKNKQLVLYIVDLNRPFTFKGIPEDIAYLKETTQDSEIKIIGNKKDLLSLEEIEQIKSDLSSIQFDGFISAKTGEGIEELFGSFVEEVYHQ